MITIRLLAKKDFDALNKFYLNALEEEHKTLVSKKDIKELLHEYEKDKWIAYWFKNTDSKAFVAVDEKNIMMGFLAAKYFDSKDSIIFYITIFPSETRNTLRDKFIKKLQEEFPDIKDMFIDVYEKDTEEVEFFMSRGFRIWETSTAPVGKKVLNVHLMQKIF